jgi:FtsH-binding integral membrane protein
VVPRPVLSAAGVAPVRIVVIVVSIPNANLIWSMAGLVIFSGYTILDFNWLRGAGAESAVPIAASIFLDVFNVFLFVLQLFGGERN